MAFELVEAGAADIYPGEKLKFVIWGPRHFVWARAYTGMLFFAERQAVLLLD